MYEAHRYLLKSTRLEAEDLKEYKSLRELFRAGDTGRIEIAIQRLCRLVYLHYQILPVILVDEYDTPLLEAYTDGCWSEMIGTCRQLFHSTFKENPYYARTLITGVTKVPKNSLFSDLNNLEKAIQANEAEETPAPTLPSLYANAGLCLSKMKKKRKAHQYCKKAQKLEPKDPEAYLIEGRMYVEEGDYEKGIKQWAKALNCAPSADTWNEIGMHSMEIGYLDYAKIAFERVCELEPEFEGINEKLTVLYMTLHDKENFIKYNQKCTRPFDLKELEKMQAMMENEDREDLAVYMQNIIKALQ